MLPSHADDWGVVVNEALQSGLAVVVSDKAGAAELVQSSGAGRGVFRPFRGATRGPSGRFDRGSLVIECHARRARAFAGRIAPAAAADYLYRISRGTSWLTSRPPPRLGSTPPPNRSPTGS